MLPYVALMKRLFPTALLLALLPFSALLGQDSASSPGPAETQAETPATPSSAPATASPETSDPAVSDETEDATRISVLGYHEFSATEKATEMRIPTAKFRLQMQAIKDLGLNVITLEDFIAWKQGKKTLPDRSILITIDDGWKSVYTDAYPILKEFEFPFTLFLYKNYVDGGGKALTSKMITEMQKHGASVGSHSTSHPYPSTVRKAQRKGPEEYQKFLNAEMGDSKKFLEAKFGSPIITYAYPGGFHTPEMFDTAEMVGYKHLFTVKPGKVKQDTNNMEIPRYIILGTHDSIFEYATSFRATGNSLGSAGAIIQTTPHPVTPAPGGSTEDRLPLISADLSRVEGLDPESLVMRVSGFGLVPAKFDPATKKFSWKVNRRLRKPTCDVSVQWKLQEKPDMEMPMRWTFVINREAAYQPKTAPSLPQAIQEKSNEIIPQDPENKSSN
ncbi:hypothetical protein Rhal01_01888 [Rubritalea halochordaticola]|uniref:NodB homology domain-containing protein n=2 Tax=Rubritalea halochordaticola TaxID=714537 RepID=A0ABP9V297_9BACT